MMNLRPKELCVTFGVIAAFVVACVFIFDGTFSNDDFSKSVPASEQTTTARFSEEIPAKAVVTHSAFSEKKPQPAQASAPQPKTPAVATVAVPAQKPPMLARVPAKAPRPAMKQFSCAGEICIDADTGEVLFGKNENVRHPPASVTKLMTIFVVLDAVSSKKIRISDAVIASQRAQDTGGTQVYLAKGEVNTVDDLLYALMLQSANDAAVALAEYVSGNVPAFVDEMNRKARELGLFQTVFSTPHGLPVSKKERAAGVLPDMTTAADLAKLSRALIAEHPEVFRYSAARSKKFRENRFGVQALPMKNHNKLLELFPGCDGLKTGWTNAGASIVTTASRGNKRVIAVVLGGIVPAAKGGVDSKTSQRERNQRAAELMFNGLKKIDALKYEPTPVSP